MKNDNSKVLIPCYCDIDAYDMPTEFKNLQGQDMGKIGFIQDLVRGIGKILRPVEVAPAVVQTIHVVENALTKRGMLYLEDGEFKLAHNYFERALDENPEDSKAYIGKILVALRKKSIEELDGLEVKWDTFKDFERAMRFGTEEEKAQLKQIKDKSAHKIAIKQLMIVLNKWALLKESKEMYDQIEEYFTLKTT
jgi:tetratricopeptide (TPR) repeat protein